MTNPAAQSLGFTVSQKIGKPVERVYRAVADGAESGRYFMRSSTGALTTGATVTWTWESYPPLAVEVEEATPPEVIRFRWDSHHSGARTTATIRFAPADGGTKVEIAESGWPDTDAGRKDAFDNCAGWQHMLLCLKAWLEHGIDLRK